MEALCSSNLLEVPTAEARKAQPSLWISAIVLVLHLSCGLASTKNRSHSVDALGPNNWSLSCSAAKDLKVINLLISIGSKHDLKLYCWAGRVGQALQTMMFPVQSKVRYVVREIRHKKTFSRVAKKLPSNGLSC